MNIKKRILSLVVSSLVGLSSFGLMNKEVKVNAQDKIKIEYWHVNSDKQGGKTVKELVKKFNESQDKIEVIEKFNPDMYKGLMQNLQASAATGTTPDVVQVGWAFLDYFSENFEYTEPQTLVEKFETENKNYLNDTFLPNVLKLAQNNEGKQVGIPYSISNPVLYINKDLLKAAGLSEEGPKTWKEVKEFSLKIKEKTGKQGLYFQQPADNWATQALLESNGAKFITDGKASFASPEGIEAYQLWADMVLVDKTCPNVSWDEGVQSFIQGDIAMLYTTIARRKQVQENANFDVTAIKSPGFEGKEVMLPAGGAMLAVTSKDEAKMEASWEFLKFLYSVENVAEWTKGTGYVPPRKGVAEDEKGLKQFLAENLMMKPAIDQMDKVVPWASFPGASGLEAEQKLLDMRDKILTGKLPVKDALEQTQNEINKLIQ